MKHWYVLLIFIEQAITNCQLKPLSFGYYYGVNKKNYSAAFKCCENKGLKLVHLNQTTKIRDALLSESFFSEPIGPANGIYVSSKPNNNHGSKKTLCIILHLASPKNISLKTSTVLCEEEFHFLCAGKELHDSSRCNSVNYTELIEDSYLYSNDKLEWREARDCCEIKGGELYRKISYSDNEDVFAALVDNAIIENGGNISFWTSGHKKLEMSHFTWSNYEQVLFENFKEDSEFCIKGTAKDRNISLKDAGCENLLNSICRIKRSKKCPIINMKFLWVNNTFRTYYYSDSYKLPWSEAVLCCRDKGLELLSVISPQEGNILASYFQTSPYYHNRHQGFPYGIWTSGRRQKDGTYEFVAVKTKTKLLNNMTNSGNHFIESSNNGSCLQYIIDTSNSYFLNNIMCKSIRSFVCEESEKLRFLYDIPLYEMGNKYFYSPSKLAWSDANDICTVQQMSLLNLMNFEEKSALAPILNLLLNNTIKSTGIWSWKSDKIEKRSSRRKGKTTTTTAQPIAKSLQTCPSISIVEDKIQNYNSNNCNKRLGFICEKQDLYYGQCNISSFSVLGEYLFHSGAATWNEGRKCCELKGKSLLSLVDERKQIEMFHHLMQKDFERSNIGVWTSGTNSIVPEKWVWQSTYEFLDTNIFYNNYTKYDELIIMENDDSQCLEAFANQHDGKVVVDHEDCDIPKPFICEDSRALFSCGRLSFNRLRRTGYYYSTGKAKWLQAQECCKEKDMTLAEFPDNSVISKLHLLIIEVSGKIHNDQNSGFWIGLTGHISNHTTFTWTESLNTIDSDNRIWSSKFHQNLENACVQAFTTENNALLLNAVPCSNQLRFLCQRQKKVENV